MRLRIERQHLPTLFSIAAIVAAALALLAPGLGHPSIHNWDEAAHQAAARGTFESFFKPHIYDPAVYPRPLSEWMEAGVWLHKPTGPFWFAALVMHVIGVTPLALRLGSWLGELAAALCLFGLVKRAAPLAFGVLAAIGFLALPFGYELTQGYIFGDATDCTLVGWVATAMFLLVLAVERDDARLATLAGAATGVGYLCKTALALTPLGVAGVFLLLALTRRGPGLRVKSFGLFVLALAVVAVPWNLYCALAWPDVWHEEATHTLGHLFTRQVAQWVRPWDALLNELNETELRPAPTALLLLALGWGVARAVKTREPVRVALATWVLSTWLVLSIALVKVPAIAWGATPGALALAAILLADASGRAWLLGAVLGASSGPWVLDALPSAARLARGLPAPFEQTRTHPQLAIGLLLAALGAAIALGAAQALRKVPQLARAGLPAMLSLAALAGVLAIHAQRAHAEELSRNADVAPVREIGQALDRALPKDALIFMQLDRDPGCCFMVQDLLFWSGRVAYRRPVDLDAAARFHLHPYLVTVGAEPYAPVPGVPAFAGARAYDLLAPADPPPIPSDATPLELHANGVDVLGFASGPRDGHHDVWTFFLRAQNPFSLPVHFDADEGPLELRLSPADTQSDPQRWRGKPWFVVSVVGPERAHVHHLRVLDTDVPLAR